MGIKFTVSKSLKNLGITTDSKGQLSLGNIRINEEIRREFNKRGPVKAKQAVVQDITKGISPVQGGGKFQKYSDSYKEVIRDKAAYRTINGKVVRFSADPAGISQKEFRSLRPSRDARRNYKAARDNLKQKVKDLNADFRAKQNPKKQVSPVNLRLSGKMINSFRVFSNNAFNQSYKLIFEFRNFLADIHNRLGAGKSRVVRRMLPTNRGERFNRRISSTIVVELNKAVDTTLKKFGLK